MAPDPRTLRRIERVADCHLIPECFGISNVTVPLDADFDHKIGRECDAQLRRYFEAFLATDVRGRLALGGGSKSLKAVHSIGKQLFIIPKPHGGRVQDFAERALGLQDGTLRFESFTGDTADCARAFMSIIHSAFLVLFHAGEQEIFASPFDTVRALLDRAANAKLTNADYEVIREMLEISVAFPPQKLQGQTVSVNDYRRLYDSSFDVGDGLLDDFPTRCVSYDDSRWLVTLPYSRSLRAKVRFDR